jgi:uncharacterized membrane protein
MTMVGWEISAGFLVLIIILMIWETVWKFLGMWRAAKNNSKAWFIVIGIINTIGILPILYLYVFSKDKKLKTKSVSKKKKR